MDQSARFLGTSITIFIEWALTVYGESLLGLVYLFRQFNYEIRLAGESVRDLLMNKLPTNLELAASASILEIKKMFENTRAVTFEIVAENSAIITIKFKNIKYKISSICYDSNDIHPETGARLKTNWERDAYRRVFTIDSMFLTFNGLLYDYFGGYADIIKSRVRSNDSHIKDNHMKIFRYFRQFALISYGKIDHDIETLQAVKENISKLENMDGKLIWRKIKLLLLHPIRYNFLELFLQYGGGKYLGLPKYIDFAEFREIAERRKFSRIPLLPISYLCAFLNTREDIMSLHHRLQLSVYERDLALFIMEYKVKSRNIDDLTYYQRMCLLPIGANRNISKEYVLELLNYNNQTILLELMSLWQPILHNYCQVSEPNTNLEDLKNQNTFGDVQKELLEKLPDGCIYEMPKKKVKIH